MSPPSQPAPASQANSVRTRRIAFHIRHPLASALDVQSSGQEALQGVAAVSYAARNPAATLKHPAAELGKTMNGRANLGTSSNSTNLVIRATSGSFRKKVPRFP